jgi:hypothetical protein
MAKSKKAVKKSEFFTEQMGREIYNFPDNCFTQHGLKRVRVATPEATVNLKRAIRTVQAKHMA